MRAGLLAQSKRTLLALILLLIGVAPVSMYVLSAQAQTQATQQPVTLAGGLSRPHAVALAGQYVYWTDAGTGTVNRIGLDGQGMLTLATGGMEPDALVVDGGYVYWTDFLAGTVSKVSIAGGGVTVLAQQQDHPLAILVYGGYVYWAESLQGNINRMAVDGGPVQSLVTGRLGIADFGIYAGQLYWTEGFTQGGDVSQISSAPLQGGNGRFFVKALKPWSLVIVGDGLYWTEYRWGGVKKVSLTTGNVTQIYGHFAQDDDFTITADDQHVYWTERTSGNIMEATLKGNSVVTIAANQMGPYGIATDGTHLVWTEERAGTVKLYNLAQANQNMIDLEMTVVVILVVAPAAFVAYRLKHKSKLHPSDTRRT